MTVYSWLFNHCNADRCLHVSLLSHCLCFINLWHHPSCSSWHRRRELVITALWGKVTPLLLSHAFVTTATRSIDRNHTRIGRSAMTEKLADLGRGNSIFLARITRGTRTFTRLFDDYVVSRNAVGYSRVSTWVRRLWWCRIWLCAGHGRHLGWGGWRFVFGVVSWKKVFVLARLKWCGVEVTVGYRVVAKPTSRGLNLATAVKIASQECWVTDGFGRWSLGIVVFWRRFNIDMPFLLPPTDKFDNYRHGT